MIRTPYIYDVFLSHAFEDKEHIANELNIKLREAGIKVWYSGQDLRVGHDLDEVILKKVIPRSLFGVVVISRNYFTADWGRTELNLLHSFETVRNYNVILPVWHGINEHDMRIEFPYLMGRFAVKTEKGIDAIVKEIVQAVEQGRKSTKTGWVIPPVFDITERFKSILTKLSFTALLILTGIFVYSYRSEIGLIRFDNQVIITTIEDRIKAVDRLASAEYTNWQYSNHVLPSDFNTARALRISFLGVKSTCRRNLYTLFDGVRTISSRKHTIEAGVKLNEVISAYGISDCTTCIDTSSTQLSYSVFNNKPVVYEITSQVENDNQLVITVQYEEPVRCAIVSLKKIPAGEHCDTEHAVFYGLSATEQYVFEKNGNDLKYIATR